ncbi:hypothetical protein ElyMa_002682500 [Elysia marginata]|uniref:Uncharacterized protein n=1 Tax=Elysia marginata TaxID=1093978 RepID=A0AAV4HEM1_9GAST|nr:hypothetical protein ElyMa_002682500 [Elysia marginata]
MSNDNNSNDNNDYMINDDEEEEEEKVEEEESEKKPTLNKRKEILSTCMHTRKYLLKNTKESRRHNDEIDLNGHDGAIEIEAIPDDAPEEEGQKHCVVRE